MTPDDDLSEGLEILKLSLAVVGVSWYAILWSLGILGCVSALVKPQP